MDEMKLVLDQLEWFISSGWFLKVFLVFTAVFFASRIVVAILRSMCGISSRSRVREYERRLDESVSDSSVPCSECSEPLPEWLKNDF